MSARASILVNGSPMYEFQIKRSLHQGYPLSPFLFIIAMKGLHIASENVLVARLFKGATLSPRNLYLPYLFYANDVLVLGEWLPANVYNILAVLDCFYSISGLKINSRKNQIYMAWELTLIMLLI